jgi:phosphoglycerate dehydrogenase-like enzyme
MRLLTLLSDSYNPDGWVDRLVELQFGSKAGWTIERAKVADARALADADAVLVLMAPIPRKALADANQLRLIQTASRGYDAVDHAAAAERKIPVCNVLTAGHAGTVAEHTFALLLAVVKRVVEGDIAITQGGWPTGALFGSGLGELSGKSLGIVGLGEIGKEVARRADAFGMALMYTDEVPAPELEQRYGMKRVDLADLLRTADIVTLHVPLAADTNRLIAERELSLMKPGGVLVNTSRGPIVDLDALAVFLHDGKLRAGLDVYDPEPPPRDHPILSAPNVVRSPHIAGVTAESVRRVLEDAFANIRRLERGEPLLNVVNGVRS